MNLEERLKIVKEIQRIINEQLINSNKTMELSKELEKDISNETIRFELKKLEIESRALSNRKKQLVSEL